MWGVHDIVADVVSAPRIRRPSAATVPGDSERKSNTTNSCAAKRWVGERRSARVSEAATSHDVRRLDVPQPGAACAAWLTYVPAGLPPPVSRKENVPTPPGQPSSLTLAPRLGEYPRPTGHQPVPTKGGGVVLKHRPRRKFAILDRKFANVPCVMCSIVFAESMSLFQENPMLQVLLKKH